MILPVTILWKYWIFRTCSILGNIKCQQVKAAIPVKKQNLNIAQTYLHVMIF